MSETDLTARKIARLLSDDVRPDVAARLAAARMRAVQVAPATQVNRAGRALRLSLAWAQLRYWVLAGALAMAIAAGHVYQTNQELDAMADLDASLLADDLPLEAYLDKAFPQFLLQHSDSADDAPIQ